MSLEGIEAELRYIQYLQTRQMENEKELTVDVVEWWQRNFAHKYVDFIYSPTEEGIVRRDKKQ